VLRGVFAAAHVRAPASPLDDGERAELRELLDDLQIDVQVPASLPPKRR
jgi:hypothetical protein